mmetsp:Transcript_1242/g.3565  ORF Transcript_1242/g.3565 Transcript_1242/m.3565 type:complete len:880 (-) Transcript_1242:10-2649(-)
MPPRWQASARDPPGLWQPPRLAPPACGAHRHLPRHPGDCPAEPTSSQSSSRRRQPLGAREALSYAQRPTHTVCSGASALDSGGRRCRLWCDEGRGRPLGDALAVGNGRARPEGALDAVHKLVPRDRARAVLVQLLEHLQHARQVLAKERLENHLVRAEALLEFGDGAGARVVAFAKERAVERDARVEAEVRGALEEAGLELGPRDARVLVHVEQGEYVRLDEVDVGQRDAQLAHLSRLELGEVEGAILVLVQLVEVLAKAVDHLGIGDDFLRGRRGRGNGHHELRHLGLVRVVCEEVVAQPAHGLLRLGLAHLSERRDERRLQGVLDGHGHLLRRGQGLHGECGEEELDLAPRGRGRVAAVRRVHRVVGAEEGAQAAGRLLPRLRRARWSHERAPLGDGPGPRQRERHAGPRAHKVHQLANKGLPLVLGVKGFRLEAREREAGARAHSEARVHGPLHDLLRVPRRHGVGLDDGERCLHLLQLGEEQGHGGRGDGRRGGRDHGRAVFWHRLEAQSRRERGRDGLARGPRDGREGANGVGPRHADGGARARLRVLDQVRVNARQQLVGHVLLESALARGEHLEAARLEGGHSGVHAGRGVGLGEHEGHRALVATARKRVRSKGEPKLATGLVQGRGHLEGVLDWVRAEEGAHAPGRLLPRRGGVSWPHERREVADGEGLLEGEEAARIRGDVLQLLGAGLWEQGARAVEGERAHLLRHHHEALALEGHYQLQPRGLLGHVRLEERKGNLLRKGFREERLELALRVLGLGHVQGRESLNRTQCLELHDHVRKLQRKDHGRSTRRPRNQLAKLGSAIVFGIKFFGFGNAQRLLLLAEDGKIALAQCSLNAIDLGLALSRREHEEERALWLRLPHPWLNGALAQ